MKDWCLKHPILTFLIIDEIIASIQTLITRNDYYSTVDEAREIAGGVVKTVVKKATEEQKEPIGFKAS